VDGRIILKLILRKWDWGVEWIHVAQVRDQWRTLVNMAINRMVP
jgi:hypothetical protein